MKNGRKINSFNLQHSALFLFEEQSRVFFKIKKGKTNVVTKIISFFIKFFRYFSSVAKFFTFICKSFSCVRVFWGEEKLCVCWLRAKLIKLPLLSNDPELI